MKFERFEHSVLEVAERLHGAHCGSGDPYFGSGAHERMVEWLEWRVNEGWEQYSYSQFSEYERAVRVLAIIAAEEGRKDVTSWAERDRKRKAEAASGTP